MTSPNLAVMANRASSLEALDFFPTPPWGTRALCEMLPDLRGAVIVEPACGRGHMSRPLAEVAATVYSSDIVDRGCGQVFDFLTLEGLPLAPPPFPADAWLVIDKLRPRPSPLVHIPPCRARLERPGDYDPPATVAAVRAIKAARKESARS